MNYFEFLPHRPPFFWITSVLSSEQDQGVCEVVLDPEAHYFLPSGRIRESSLFEFMAQSRACIQAHYIKSLHPNSTEKSPLRAYLVGLKNFKIENIFFQADHLKLKSLHIHVKTIKDLPPFSLVSAEIIESENKNLLARAQLKLFCD